MRNLWRRLFGGVSHHGRRVKSWINFSDPTKSMTPNVDNEAIYEVHFDGSWVVIRARAGGRDIAWYNTRTVRHIEWLNT